MFVAGGPLDLVDAAGNECSISDGDVLQLQTAPPDDATTASLYILVSKGGNECARADTVTVQLTDLQEMQNQLRANIDQGLKDLQAKQGTGGIPQAPPSAQGSADHGSVCGDCASTRSGGCSRSATAGPAG